MEGRQQPQAGKKSIWYLHCPIMAIASDEEGILVACGGGGQRAAKEVPNVIEAFRFEKGKLTSFACESTEKSLCTGVRYVPELKWWLCNVVNAVRIYTLDDAFHLIVKFVTETDASPKTGMWVNSCHMVDYSIATGGSDGIVRRWTIANEDSVVEGPSYKADAGEVQDVAFSASMKFLASCHDGDKVIRLWDTASGAVHVSISWESFKPRRIEWVDEQLLVLASGVRGPSKLRLYDVSSELTLKTEVMIDKLSATSLAMSQSAELLVVGTANGVKRILSFPSLKVLKKTGEVHDIPLTASTFLHPLEPVSGSGDYVLHFGPTIKPGNARHKLVLVFFFTFLLSLLYNLAMKIGAQSSPIQ